MKCVQQLADIAWPWLGQEKIPCAGRKFLGLVAGLWIDKSTREDLRAELADRDIHVAAFRHYLELDGSDGVPLFPGNVPVETTLLLKLWSEVGILQPDVRGLKWNIP